MPVNLTWVFHSNSFCFCIPIRAGFVLMSVLTFLLSGALSIILWFELFHSYQLSSKERVAFVLAGVVESLLFIASIAGFIGVVARKQLFVTTYTYFLYVHFVFNLIVGIYFLVTVRASNRQQLVVDCAQVLTNTSVESSCAQLMHVSTYVFIAIVTALLLLEFYGVLIVTRYMYRLRMQKRDDRSRRLGYFHALSAPKVRSTNHTRQASDDIELLHSRESTGDQQDLEDAVLDIRAQSYLPVPTYDRDLPLVPAPSQTASFPSSGMNPTRPIRALPPRPVDKTIPAVVRTPGDSQEGAVPPGRLLNPYEPQPLDSEDGQHSLDTSVSPSVHAALMAHATYMKSIFAPVPNPSVR